MTNADHNRRSRIVIGRISSSEREEIMRLFERRNGLGELLKSIPGVRIRQKKELINQVVAEREAVSKKYRSWWRRMSWKYHWKGGPSQHWEVDFDTGEIILREKNNPQAIKTPSSPKGSSPSV